MCLDYRKQILGETEEEEQDINTKSGNDNKEKEILNRFKALAKKESDCNSYKREGDLGAFGRGRMQKPFEHAAFGLNIGQLSEPVETDSGVHLIFRYA